MKKINFIILALILGLSNSLFAQVQTWDIFDKSMTRDYNGWEINTTSGNMSITQHDGYVNLAKSGNWAWFRPILALGNLMPATPYSVEVKVRVNSGEQAQVSLRMNGGTDQITAAFFLKYGTSDGSISTVAGGASNAYTLNTSEWHVYRLVLQADHRNFDVYVDDAKEPVLATGKTAPKTDQSGVYFGAESSQACNIDIEYVKMGTGDFYSIYNATLSSLSVDAGTLIPAFSPNRTQYVCELFTDGPDAVTPSATAASESADITGLEPVTLNSGRGVSTITVTAGDGETTKTYTINYLKVGEDLSSLIVNNDFEYVAEGVLWNDNTNPNYPKFSDDVSTFVANCFRPVRTDVTKIDTHAEFYGWQMSDWSFMFTNANGTTPAQSIGIGGGNPTTHGTAAPWIAGNVSMRFPENFEFYQAIDKDNISGGTYKVTCILGIQAGHLTSQRLFANQNVQFFGKESDYAANKTVGEIYSYAGYAPSGENDGKGLKVYVTISGGDSLKLGLRGGSLTGNNTYPTGNLPGWFKFDYFTLTKIDPAVAADASLSGITLSTGSLEFSPETDIYDVTLPTGTTAVTPVATGSVPDVTITGTEEVDLTSGTGTSIIEVTALDGTTTKTYTLNYATMATGLRDVGAKAVSHHVNNRQLSVKGVESYAVYNINGIKIAEVKDNAPAVSVSLLPGMYVVKTKNAEAFKIVVY